MNNVKFEPSEIQTLIKTGYLSGAAANINSRLTRAGDPTSYIEPLQSQEQTAGGILLSGLDEKHVGEGNALVAAYEIANLPFETLREINEMLSEGKKATAIISKYNLQRKTSVAAKAAAMAADAVNSIPPVEMTALDFLNAADKNFDVDSAAALDDKLLENSVAQYVSRMMSDLRKLPRYRVETGFKDYATIKAEESSMSEALYASLLKRARERSAAIKKQQTAAPAQPKAQSKGGPRHRGDY